MGKTDTSSDENYVEFRIPLTLEFHSSVNFKPQLAEKRRADENSDKTHRW